MENDKKLIIFYSQTGNTKHIAELIQEQTGGELVEVEAVTPYKSLYLGGAQRVKKERNEGTHPPIKTVTLDEGKYQNVFLGTPNWGNGIAHPIMTLLDQYHFENATIYPFCTHGGGGLAHVALDIEKRCPEAKIGKSFDIYGDGGAGAKKAVEAWIHSLDLGGANENNIR
ncbi:MAG: flavodoxin [Lachnospiraceae bacterium]|nr:flavodoxin [Lachnospiraceae bacterium]